jgi:hypothetical protein
LNSSKTYGRDFGNVEAEAAMTFVSQEKIKHKSGVPTTQSAYAGLTTYANKDNYR